MKTCITTATKDNVSKHFREQKRKEVEAIRLRFSDDFPKIGERCIVWQGKREPTYFAVRVSENYFQSNSWTIPIDTKGLMVVTLREVK